MGLSSGVWQALHAVKTPEPTPDRVGPSARRSAKPSGPPKTGTYTPVRKAKGSPTAVRWSPAQRTALSTFRAFGEFILDDHPTPADVKKAYWRLARQMHPDTCAHLTEDTHRKFCELQAAWEELREGPLPEPTGAFRSLF